LLDDYARADLNDVVPQKVLAACRTVRSNAVPDDPVSTASQREQELAALDLIEHPTGGDQSLSLGRPRVIHADHRDT
jgi:hypothetical protein